VCTRGYRRCHAAEQGALDTPQASGAAAKLAGVQTADLSRIRNADLSRFTIDRLVTILNRLNRHVEVCLTVRAGPQSIPLLSFPEMFWTIVFQVGKRSDRKEV
jgi:hypothetical protein